MINPYGSAIFMLILIIGLLLYLIMKQGQATREYKRYVQEIKTMTKKLNEDYSNVLSLIEKAKKEKAKIIYNNE